MKVIVLRELNIPVEEVRRGDYIYFNGRWLSVTGCSRYGFQYELHTVEGTRVFFHPDYFEYESKDILGEEFSSDYTAVTIRREITISIDATIVDE